MILFDIMQKLTLYCFVMVICLNITLQYSNESNQQKQVLKYEVATVEGQYIVKFKSRYSAQTRKTFISKALGDLFSFEDDYQRNSTDSVRRKCFDDIWSSVVSEG